MNRREFLKLIRAAIGGAIVAKFVKDENQEVLHGELYIRDNDPRIVRTKGKQVSTLSLGITGITFMHGDNLIFAVVNDRYYYMDKTMAGWCEIVKEDALRYFEYANINVSQI